ncbi:aldo/keto reductase [Acidobacteriota bacterium]
MKSEDKTKMRISRRDFIGSSLAAAAGLGINGKDGLFGGKTIQELEKPKIKEYRTLGRTGFKVSDISFGGGSLTDEAILATALEAGVNYIDTAEHYSRGNSETNVGKVLKGRDRKSMFITTKLNFRGGLPTKESLRDRFLKCLERLQMDYVDCLMIHMTPKVEQVTHEPYHELIRELKTEGKVRFSGLSCHGTEHTLYGNTKERMEDILLAAADDGRFDVALFVYNFMQKEQGEKILKACKDKNMGTTLMKVNPIKFYSDIEVQYNRVKDSGREMSDAQKDIYEEVSTRSAEAESFKDKYGITGAALALEASIKFCLSNPDVHAVCPTPNTYEDLDAFLAQSGQRLESRDKEFLADYQASCGAFYCRHACGECESACPNQVPVNSIMRYDHYFRAQGREKYALEHYARISGQNAGFCKSCPGFCQQACPFNVPIHCLLTLAHQTLTLA